MTETLLLFFDIVGTIAFAISGAFMGVRKKMDIFGVTVLAITTACGGGLMRDLIVGNIPPYMFRNPVYVGIATVVANIVFWLVHAHQKMPRNMTVIYDKMLFWFDTLGLAAFTVDGVTVGIGAGHAENLFLIVFLGFMTGVGGGTARDVLADQIPDIFLKHIYAVASIAGGLTMALLYHWGARRNTAMVAGFSMVILLRCLAAHFRWNLPRIT